MDGVKDAIYIDESPEMKPQIHRHFDANDGRGCANVALSIRRQAEGKSEVIVLKLPWACTS